jgi:hypothetical protein
MSLIPLLTPWIPGSLPFSFSFPFPFLSLESRDTGTILVRIRITAPARERTARPSPSLRTASDSPRTGREDQSPALLVAIEEGMAGEDAICDNSVAMGEEMHVLGVAQVHAAGTPSRAGRGYANMRE